MPDLTPRRFGTNRIDTGEYRCPGLAARRRNDVPVFEGD
jgi:hypothetical protein